MLRDEMPGTRVQRAREEARQQQIDKRTGAPVLD